MYTFDKSILGTQKLLDEHIRLSSVLSYCQEIALEHAAKMQINNANLNGNVCWILNRISAIFSGAPCKSNSITVTTSPCAGKGVSYPRQYTISDGDIEIVRLSSDWSVLDMTSRRIVRLGDLDGYLDNCEDPMQDVAAMPKERARAIQDWQYVGEFVVMRSQIDEVGHMNNTCYGDVVWDMLDEDTAARGINTFNITFIKEALLGDVIKIYRIVEDDGVVLQGMNANGNSCFVAKVGVMAI